MTRSWLLGLLLVPSKEVTLPAKICSIIFANYYIPPFRRPIFSYLPYFIANLIKQPSQQIN